MAPSGAWPCSSASVVVCITILVGFVHRMFTIYTITTQRLRIQRGIVSRRVQQTRIERVQNVNTDQGVLERLLQVGSVDFDTAGTTDSDFRFNGVGNPEDVVTAVDRAQRQHSMATSAAGGDPTRPTVSEGRRAGPRPAQARVPLNGCSPSGPALTIPAIASPSTVALKSRSTGIGWVTDTSRPGRCR